MSPYIISALFLIAAAHSLLAEIELIVVPSEHKVAANEVVELTVYLKNNGEKTVRAPIPRISDGYSVGSVSIYSSFYTVSNDELENVGGGGGGENTTPIKLTGVDTGETRKYKFKYELPKLIGVFDLVTLQVKLWTSEGFVDKSIVLTKRTE